MNPSTVRTAHEGPVAIVTLDRPPANALDTGTVRHLRTTIQELGRGGPTHAIVLTGQDETFCAGLDLKLLPQLTAAERNELGLELGGLIVALYGCPLPVVAAVTGHAVAAGTLLLLCCDYRIGPRTDCRFGLTGARVGVPYPASALSVIAATLSPVAARRLLLAARTLGADEALDHGILDETVDRPGVRIRARQVAEDLAAFPGGAYADTKRNLRRAVLERIETAVERDRSVGWMTAPPPRWPGTAP